MFRPSQIDAVAGERAAPRNGTAWTDRTPLFRILSAIALWVALLPAQSPEHALLESDRHRRNGDPEAALAALDRVAVTFADRPLIHFNRGAILGELDRHEEAVRALRVGLALEPSHAAARLTLAKVLVRGHHFEEALVQVDRYAAIVGDLFQGFEGYYVRGLVLRKLDRPGEAEQELRRAVDIDPGHVDALFNLGAALDQHGADEEAIEYLRKAATLEPDNAEIRYRLGRVLAEAGMEDASNAELARFQELRERAQRDTRVYVLMRQAEQSLHAGNPERAKDLYQEVIRQEAGHAEAHANLGLAYGQLGRDDLAEAMFRKAVDLKPDYADAHLNLGLQQAENGHFPEALKSISEAVRLAPDHVVARQGLAMVLTRLNRPLEAVPHFERIIRENPSSSAARLNLGIALAEGGAPEAALDAFSEATRLAPQSYRPHYNRGRALKDLGRTPEAREALEKAIELNHRYAPALQLLGTLERTAGNATRAIKFLERATEVDPSNPLVHYDLGLAISQSGRPGDAISHWEQALSLEPRHKESIYNLAQALQSVDPARARELLEQFARLKSEEQDTDRAGTLWNFALAEANREQWDRAFELFRQALEACGGCPALGQIHKNFGLVYGHSGDYVNAERELVRAQKLLPDDEEIKQALEVVRSRTQP